MRYNSSVPIAPVRPTIQSAKKIRYHEENLKRKLILKPAPQVIKNARNAYNTALNHHHATIIQNLRNQRLAALETNTRKGLVKTYKKFNPYGSYPSLRKNRKTRKNRK
jgi:hypothetical protein